MQESFVFPDSGPQTLSEASGDISQISHILEGNSTMKTVPWTFHAQK